ncbi:MAG: 3-dehydroquinate synthase [Campylobacterales bacterium]|nr:3-dehydroquinate synthase [Campylobacterales bacterium]
MIVPIDLKKQEDLSYEIFIEDLKDLTYERKVAIVTNPTVAGFHLETVKNKIKASELIVIELPDGEQYKTLDSVNEILNQLLENRFNRKSLLIAFGGGVIGDMTGFAASIFQRGIDFVQIPTTLLSMVDASVGGKTGVNNKYGKNLIGVFHQPKAVHIDINFLKTLPSREFGAGVAELIKMAVMFDRDFFSWLEKNDLKEKENLIYAVKRSVELKAEVVSKDEKEQGIRAVLNYGHTFGHVVENETAYKEYLHGEAVGIGMCMANIVGSKLGLFTKEELKRVENLLKKYDIPTSYQIQNPQKFYEAFFLDKKSTDSKIKFIFPNGIGDFLVRDDVEKETIIKVLENFSKEN